MRAALRLARPMAAAGRRLRSTAAAPASLAASWDRPFPSLLISENEVTAQGSFAEAQANYLKPDMQVVKELDALLHEKKMGIVAHFYMDPELQGVLSSLSWEHTFIADSLAMGEAAAKMAAKGIQSVAVLGVDFMSESVRANLDSNGFEHIPVYRLAEQKIGCSLAESAERQAYIAYLQKASKTPNSLHIVYINTSLRSKAFAHDLVPTITCTSSNVVQTVLQAFVQVPDITIWYGPDTYMGENLEQMFQQMGQLPDDKIREIHPQHNQKTIAELLTRFHYFKEGNCVVHHMFGDKVTKRVRDEYSDAFHTAHFEVPGEMFTLAMDAQNEGRGVVGSTSNILNFIKDKTREAVKKQSTEKLSFVLGTEVGMVTAIVRGVQETLRSQPGSQKPEIEIIFPVSADAVATEGDELVPGVAGGEGCSTAGGCATCPFMKMNDIDALFKVVEGVSANALSGVDPLANFYPQKYSELISGKTISDIGVQPILHMKAFMEGRALSSGLVKDIQTRTPGAGCPESNDSLFFLPECSETREDNEQEQQQTASMADDKAASDSKDTTPSAAAPAAGPPCVKAPPKTSPPADAKASEGGDVKDAAEPGAKKKKALPPPSNPPPQGTTSAAAAFRAKSTLPPPNGPPPTGAAPSASVAKIRGAARPPSAGPPPSGAALAKPMGAPPSTKPPPKGTPPSAASAISKAEAKPADETQDGAKAAGPVPLAKEKPEAKKAPPMRAPEMAGEAKTPRPSTTSNGGAKAAPVDILGDSSPILSPSTATLPIEQLSVPLSAKIPKQAPRNPPVQPQAQMRPRTSAAMEQQAAAFKPAIVKKSTMEVLNDTTASLSLRSRNIDEHLAKTTALSAVTNDERGSSSGSTTSAAVTMKVGRAVPFSGSSRPNVPEEEVITVKKQEAKKPDPEGDEGTAEGKQTALGDAKQTKSSSNALTHHQLHFDDSLDDVEEIPFLEEAKPEPKLVEKMEAKKMDVSDDDPIIEIENKHAAPKAISGGSGAQRASATQNSSSAAPPDAKDTEHKSNNNYYEDKADDDALLSTRRESSHEDIYDELRKLRRSSPRLDEDSSDPSFRANSSQQIRRESVDEGDGEVKDSHSSDNSRDKSREKRKEKRRSKLDDEPKKIQAQFFNPKSVPYVPDHLLDFAKRPLECGRGHIMKCFIERNDSGPNKLSPIYTLLLEVNSSSGRPIMYARKKAASRITSHYVISMNKDDLFLSRMMRSHQYIGKLRSSTSMLEYCLYDQGDNPEDLDSDCEVDDELRKSIRAELAVIRYHNSKKSYARKMEVVIPTIVENGSSYLDWRPISRDQMMEEHVRAITTAGGQNVLDTANFVFLHKRETKYDPLSSCIVDFRSRATCVSVKNFQLVHSEPTSESMRDKYRKLHPEYVYEDQGTVSLPQEHVLLQLGKVGKDCFNMDFQYPLSMLQAFAISLSRFDTKQR